MKYSADSVVQQLTAPHGTKRKGKAMHTSGPSFSAVIVTRHRPAMLRRTLQSILESSYPVLEILVSDDSTDDATAQMLAAEFPSVRLLTGPRRGISANRNNGIRAANGDYVLLSDDDMVVDPAFLERAAALIQSNGYELISSTISNDGNLVIPNTLGFLGYSSKPYKPGMPLNTANQQCFVIERELAIQLPYDEAIEVYGYEEMDFGYRVAASGATIHNLESCVHLHLAPTSNQPIRPEQDASRLYVTFKRAAYVDRRPLKALAFLALALPHHLLSCVRRYGLRGIRQAFHNFRLAARMLRTYQRQLA